MQHYYHAASVPLVLVLLACLLSVFTTVTTVEGVVAPINVARSPKAMASKSTDEVRNNKQQPRRVDAPLSGGKVISATAPPLRRSAVITEEYTAEQKRHIATIVENPGAANAYIDIGNTFKDADDYVEIPSRRLNRQAAFLMAIRLDPMNAVAYNNLGITLDGAAGGTTVALHDGTQLTKQQLFMKAIEVDPTFGHAYSNLAETMQPGQLVNYPDGRQLGRVDLLVKSIELDPKYPNAWYHLGVALSQGDPKAPTNKENPTMVRMPGAPPLPASSSSSQSKPLMLTAKSCFVRCVNLGHTVAIGFCYERLCEVMDQGDHVGVKEADGSGRMTRIDKAECLRRRDLYMQPQGK